MHLALSTGRYSWDVQTSSQVTKRTGENRNSRKWHQPPKLLPSFWKWRREAVPSIASAIKSVPSSVRGGACQDGGSEGEAGLLQQGSVWPVQAVCRPHARRCLNVITVVVIIVQSLKTLRVRLMAKAVFPVLRTDRSAWSVFQTFSWKKCCDLM